MTISRYLLGGASTAIVAASLTVAASALRRRLLPGWTGAPALLAATVLWLSLLVGILELLGAVGLFRLGPVVVASILLGWGCRRLRPPTDRPSDDRASRGWCAMILVGVLAAEWAGPTLQSYDVGIKTFDSVWYHLPWAASFAQTGHITQLRFTDVEYLTAFYPATSELLHGLGIVLLGRDTLSPGLNLVWLGLGLVAAYCIGRPRGVGALTMLGAAVAFSTPMFAGSQAGSAANDVVGVFFLLAAVALWVNAEGDRAAVALAAISAGLAVSVKLSLLAPVAALTVGVIVASGSERLRVARVWIVGVLIAGGFWYVRNLIAVGNPLPWLGVGGLLATPTAPVQQSTGFSVAHYLSHTALFSRVFGPGLVAGLGPWWPAILAAAVIGPLLCLLPGAGATVRMLGLIALASLLAYLITPETAAGPAGQPVGFAFNLRYAAPALALALVALPLAPSVSERPARVRLGVAGILTVILVATLAQGQLWPTGHLAGALGVGLAAGAAVAAAFAGGRVFAAVIAIAIVAAAIGGYPWQRHYLRGRYAFQPGVSYLARTWAYFRRIHDARVGVVGTFGGFFSYPLYGLDDSNRVEYIARHGPNGSFTPITTCREWRIAVNAGDFQYVVTTPARDPWHPKPLLPSPEGAWTASSPNAPPVLRRLATGQPITVFRLRGRLDPDTCQ